MRGFKPASSTSIAALEPAPPDPIINTSDEIVFISIILPCKIICDSIYIHDS